jgi:hypothetical protein
MNKIRSSFLSLFALAMGTVLIGGAAYAAPIVVPIAGTVTDAAGTVALKGNASIETRLVPDEFGGPPSVVVSIHVLNMTGHGFAPGSVFQASGETVLVRPLAASDTVQLGMSLFAPGSDASRSTGMATATFALSLDPATGAPLAAAGTFAPPAP